MSRTSTGRRKAATHPAVTGATVHPTHSTDRAHRVGGVAGAPAPCPAAASGEGRPQLLDFSSRGTDPDHGLMPAQRAAPASSESRTQEHIAASAPTAPGSTPGEPIRPLPERTPRATEPDQCRVPAQRAAPASSESRTQEHITASAPTAPGSTPGEPIRPLPERTPRATEPDQCLPPAQRAAAGSSESRAQEHITASAPTAPGSTPGEPIRPLPERTPRATDPDQCLVPAQRAAAGSSESPSREHVTASAPTCPGLPAPGSRWPGRSRAPRHIELCGRRPC